MARRQSCSSSDKNFSTCRTGVVSSIVSRVVGAGSAVATGRGVAVGAGVGVAAGMDVGSGAGAGVNVAVGVYVGVKVGTGLEVAVGTTAATGAAVGVEVAADEALEPPHAPTASSASSVISNGIIRRMEVQLMVKIIRSLITSCPHK